MTGRIGVILFVLSVSIYGINALEFTDCGKQTEKCVFNIPKIMILKIPEKKVEQQNIYLG